LTPIKKEGTRCPKAARCSPEGKEAKFCVTLMRQGRYYRPSTTFIALSKANVQTAIHKSQRHIFLIGLRSLFLK
jgi:hypothetical protein